jgi:hypothetical protein
MTFGKSKVVVNFCVSVLFWNTVTQAFAVESDLEEVNEYTRQTLVPVGEEELKKSTPDPETVAPKLSEPLDDTQTSERIEKMAPAAPTTDPTPSPDEVRPSSFVPSNVKLYSALYRTQIHFYTAKIANNGGNATLQKIWYFGGDFVGWILPWLGWEGTAEWVPKATSNTETGVKSYFRTSIQTGPRLGTLGSDRFRFYLSPLLQFSSLKVQSFVGTTTLNNPVFSEFGGISKFFPGGALGTNFLLSVLDVDLGTAYFLRRSNDDVQQSMFSIYGKVKFPIDLDFKAFQPNVFLFSRYEKYSWKESYSQGNSRNLDTSWALVGLGLGASL